MADHKIEIQLRVKDVNLQQKVRLREKESTSALLQEARRQSRTCRPLTSLGKDPLTKFTSARMTAAKAFVK